LDQSAEVVSGGSVGESLAGAAEEEGVVEVCKPEGFADFEVGAEGFDGGVGQREESVFGKFAFPHAQEFVFESHVGEV